MVAGLLIATSTATYGQVDVATPAPISGQPVTVEEITPADVLARIGLVRDELELIRFEMGEPLAQPKEIIVTDAFPREVIFQAFTLFGKSNQLGFEVTEARVSHLQISLPRDIQPYHVWRIVDGAYRRILAVKRELGITEQVEEIPQDLSATPSDVLSAVIQVNRQIDSLLNKRVSAADVYYQVILANFYTADLLEQFPEATSTLEVPALERGKRPSDVYDILIECFTRLRAIMELSGIEALNLKILEVSTNMNDGIEIRPSEVYDLAVLIISELVYLHAQLKDGVPPIQSFDPGFKVPAETYQQASFLHLQLIELERRVQTKSDWISGPATRI